jgi:hypothetical protein
VVGRSGGDCRGRRATRWPDHAPRQRWLPPRPTRALSRTATGHRTRIQHDSWSQREDSCTSPPCPRRPRGRPQWRIPLAKPRPRDRRRGGTRGAQAPAVGHPRRASRFGGDRSGPAGTARSSGSGGEDRDSRGLVGEHNRRDRQAPARLGSRCRPASGRRTESRSTRASPEYGDLRQLLALLRLIYRAQRALGPTHWPPPPRGHDEGYLGPTISARKGHPELAEPPNAQG